MKETTFLEPKLEEAFNPLTDEMADVLVRNHKKFLSFLTQKIGDPNLAEDLLQQSLQKALRSPAPLRGESGLLPWFHRILKNALTDAYRSRAAEKRKKDGFERSLLMQKEASAFPDPEIATTVCECLTDLLKTLRPPYADLIRRIDLEGGTVREAAAVLKISPNNLHVRLHRARQALKISLERACGTCTRHGCFQCTCRED